MGQAQRAITAAYGGSSRSRVAAEIFEHAGVTINGSRPWDPQIHDERVWDRVLVEGNLGFGEAYTDGWWDCQALDEFFCRVLKADLPRHVRKWSNLWPYLRARLLNLQRPSRAFQIGEAHYDRGNDLFERMLDKRLTYSCAYWQDTDDLETAQEKKLELICRKLHLEPGMTVLDIGCGWGSFASYAAEKYGVEVDGVTVSREQCQWASERYAHLPVRFRLQDYRDVHEQYDRVVSVGMFEHVGYKNYRTFMRVSRRCLKNGGLLLLHTIGRRKTSVRMDPWIEKYIFPNGYLPSVCQIGGAIEDFFVMEDWHNFGPHYDKTLMAWHDRFQRHWPEISEKYGERFRRMWQYYLLSCAGTFRARQNQVWQIVLSPEGVDGGYDCVRQV